MQNGVHVAVLVKGNCSIGAFVRQGKGQTEPKAPCQALVDRISCYHAGPVIPRKTAFRTRPLFKNEADVCKNVCKFACRQ